MEFYGALISYFLRIISYSGFLRKKKGDYPKNFSRSKHPRNGMEITQKVQLQPRIIYYIMAPILTAVAEGTIRGLFDLNQGMNDSLKFLSSILFAGEFIFALILQTQFTCTLPTKNFLSSKNNTTQILTLLQKFINHMVRKILIVAFPATVVVWPANLIIILLSFVRLGLYFYDLPAYDVDCLFYQMYFLMVVLAHNVACTLQLFVGEETIDMNLVIGIWFILSIFFLIPCGQKNVKIFLSIFEEKKWNFLEKLFVWENPEKYLKKIFQSFWENEKSRAIVNFENPEISGNFRRNS